ncbi:MAG: antitoxin family protein [Acidobacteria bacterium]|nr:antitoxin family protein [Acidobacteriota bacterium]
MQETIEAIYENGTFKPLHPVDLPEGTRVTIAAPTPSDQTDEAFLQQLIADGASPDEAEKILANFRLLWESYDTLTEEQKASLEKARLDQEHFFAHQP